jgi:type II secretory pathway component GspD/PulD (secretin)
MRECRGFLGPHAAAIVSVVVGIVVSAAAAPMAVGAPPLITSVTMTENSDSIVITIQASAPIVPTVEEFSTRPHAIALAIPAKMAAGATQKWVIKSGGIFVVRSTQYKTRPYVARVVASVGPGPHARTVEPSDGGRTIVFTVYKAGHKPPDTASGIVDPNTPAASGAVTSSQVGISADSSERVAGWAGFFPESRSAAHVASTSVGAVPARRPVTAGEIACGVLTTGKKAEPGTKPHHVGDPVGKPKDAAAIPKQQAKPVIAGGDGVAHKTAAAPRTQPDGSLSPTRAKPVLAPEHKTQGTSALRPRPAKAGTATPLLLQNPRRAEAKRMPGDDNRVYRSKSTTVEPQSPKERRLEGSAPVRPEGVREAMEVPALGDETTIISMKTAPREKAAGWRQATINRVPGDIPPVPVGVKGELRTVEPVLIGGEIRSEPVKDPKGETSVQTGTLRYRGCAVIQIGPDGKRVKSQTPYSPTSKYKSHVGIPPTIGTARPQRMDTVADDQRTVAWLGGVIRTAADAARAPETERAAGWIGEMLSTAAAARAEQVAAVTERARQFGDPTATTAEPPGTTIGEKESPWWSTNEADTETLDDVWRESGTTPPANPTNEVIIDLDEGETLGDALGDGSITAQSGFEPHVIGSGARISVEFVETDIADVLAGISVQTGMNIVAGPEVTGKITLRLLNSDPAEVIQMATAIAGYSCEKVGNTYLVGTPEGIEAVKLGGSSSLKITKVLPAYYERPADVAKMLTDHLKGLSATVSTISSGGEDETGGARALIITGPPSQVAEAETILGELAAIPASVRDREAIHVYEAKYADPVDLMRILGETVPEVRAIPGPVSGFKPGAAGSAQKSSFSAGGSDSGMIPLGGSGGAGAGGAASGGDATRAETVGAASNRLILMGMPEVIEQALSVLETADVPEKQVLVHLRIADVNTTNSKKLGTLWDWANETWTEMTFESKGETVPDMSVTGTGFESRVLHRTPMQITMTLDALYQNGNAKLLADPRVSVLSNRQATFFVGDKILYPVIAGVSSGTVLYSIETEEVGIGMDVIPQVAPDGTIALSIHPFVNSITQWVSTPQGDFPQTRKREAQTTVRLRSGETVALGGLISENDVETLSKVPIIGDLPILGKLFQHRHTTKGRSEVVVLITCEIVDDLPAEEGE